MKRLLVILLIIALFAIILTVTSEFKYYSTNKPAELEPIKALDANTKNKKSSGDVKEVAKADSAVARGCENMFNSCPECKQKWDSLLDEVVLIGEEAAGSGPYSLMPQENLIALAEQNDPNGLLYYGINLAWRGALGFPFARHPSNYTPPTSEAVKNHKLDLEMVKRGEKLLFEAAVKGKHQGWTEMQNAKSMVFRKLLKQGSDEKEVLRELLAQQLALSNVVSKIYKDDPFILEFYFVGLTEDIDDVLQHWNSGAKVLDFSDEKSTIDSLANNYAQEYFDKWQEARTYLGESIFPKEYPDNFADFYKLAMPVCLPDS